MNTEKRSRAPGRKEIGRMEGLHTPAEGGDRNNRCCPTIGDRRYHVAVYLVPVRSNTGFQFRDLINR